MKILLVGEYSRLHNSLKEGLLVLGHEVTLISAGDFFKDFPSDIKLTRHFEKGLLKKLKVGIYKLFRNDIGSMSLKHHFFKHSEAIKGFDVVQLINQNPIGIQAKHEREIINFLKNHNNKLFLLACGTDYISVKYAFEKKLKHSIFTPYFEGKISKKAYQSIFKKISEQGEFLFKFIREQCDGIIASDLDYHIPYLGEEKYLGMVPNPVNTDKIKFTPLVIGEKIVIFHGINKTNYFKKGNDIFEAALKIVQEKYADKIEIITVQNLPYKDYIKAFDQSHILLDQIYAYDQGYNALEAMAKGKVVFTGAEQEFLDHYNLTENEVCINALPDAKKIAEKLEWLIDNPNEIFKISGQARAFIEREHHYVASARRYLEFWKL